MPTLLLYAMPTSPLHCARFPQRWVRIGICVPKNFRTLPLLILCYSPLFTWSSEQQRLQLHFCHDNHCIMKPSGDFNSAACDTGRCWYVSEQTRDKNLYTERVSWCCLWSAALLSYPPGCSHHGVKTAPHRTDELMEVSKRQPVRSSGPWSQGRINPARNWVPHCKDKNTGYSWGRGLFQATEDNHLQQSWKELFLLRIRNYLHVLSSKPIAL